VGGTALRKGDTFEKVEESSTHKPVEEVRVRGGQSNTAVNGEGEVLVSEFEGLTLCRVVEKEKMNGMGLWKWKRLVGSVKGSARETWREVQVKEHVWGLGCGSRDWGKIRKGEWD